MQSLWVVNTRILLSHDLTVPDALSTEYLEHHLVLPLTIEDGALKLAAVGEPATYVMEDMVTVFGLPVVLVDADESELRDAIRQARRSKDTVVELVSDLGQFDSAETSLTAAEDIRDRANQAPVIRFVNVLIREAAQTGASDIHLDSTRDGLGIRVRIDGVLSRLPSPPPGLHDAVFSRLKLMASLDIAERRLPQDGRVRVRLEERELDLRVATAPNHFGESMTLRLLDRGGRPVGLDELGLPSGTLTQFRQIAARPHGELRRHPGASCRERALRT